MAGLYEEDIGPIEKTIRNVAGAVGIGGKALYYGATQPLRQEENLSAFKNKYENMGLPEKVISPPNKDAIASAEKVQRDATVAPQVTVDKTKQQSSQPAEVTQKGLGATGISAGAAPVTTAAEVAPEDRSIVTTKPYVDQAAINARDVSSGLPEYGANLNVNAERSDADQRESNRIAGTYSSAINQTMTRANELANNIERGLYTGHRLKSSLMMLNQLQEMLPVLIQGGANFHKGIMDVDTERLTKGKIPAEELKYKLGLLPLEIEEKKATASSLRAGAKQKEAEASYYDISGQHKAAETAALPSQGQKHEEKMAEIKANKELALQQQDKADIDRIQNNQNYVDKKSKANDIANILGRTQNVAVVADKNNPDNVYIMDKATGRVLYNF
jgi:hypothetical protein